MPSVLLSPAPITAVISGHPVCSLTLELESRPLWTRPEQKESSTFWKIVASFPHTMGRVWQSLMLCCIIVSLRMSMLIGEDGMLVDVWGWGGGVAHPPGKLINI